MSYSLKHRKSGEGKLVCKKGTKYEGNFSEDHFSGFGVFTFSKEDKRDYYKGHWKEGKKSGNGKLVWKTGRIIEGVFENDDVIGFGVLTRN
jgi:hypothetical protein